MGILVYQLLIVASLLVTRVVARPHLLTACLIWSALTLINVFWPPLLLLQLFVIWTTYGIIVPREGPGSTPRPGSPARPPPPKPHRTVPAPAVARKPVPEVRSNLPSPPSLSSPALPSPGQEAAELAERSRLRLIADSAWKALVLRKLIGSPPATPAPADAIQQRLRDILRPILPLQTPGVAQSTVPFLPPSPSHASFLSEVLDTLKPHPALKEEIRRQLQATGDAVLLARLGFARSLPHPEACPRLLRPPVLTASQAQRAAIEWQVRVLDIPYLVHFTRAGNLVSILLHGLCSVQKAEQLGLTPQINDTQRLDGHPGAISVSIGFPNHRMFYKCRQLSGASDVWVVLLIAPDLLWDLDCAFCQRNAADHRIRGRPLAELKTAEALRGLFHRIDGLPSREEQRLQPFDPTDVQAEVLVFDTIAPGRIIGVAFDNAQTMQKFAHLRGGRSWQVFKPGQGLFGSRSNLR